MFDPAYKAAYLAAEEKKKAASRAARRAPHHGSSSIQHALGKSQHAHVPRLSSRQASIHGVSESSLQRMWRRRGRD